MAAATTTISLKLLVNKDSGKVLFAEAGKDFVDFLFGLLEFPLGSIMSLLVKHDMPRIGSLGKIYQSVQNLNSTYLQQNQQTKESLLKPKSASSSNWHKSNPNPLLQQLAYQGQTTTTTTTITTTHGNTIPSSLCCDISKGRLVGRNKKKERSKKKKTPSVLGHTATIYCDNAITLYNGHNTNCGNTSLEGYVKDVVTYMVMDDLEVKPMSAISSVTILNTFGVKDVGCLQEKTVEVDMGKGLELLKASFDSTTVLTDIFLRKKVA